MLYSNKGETNMKYIRTKDEIYEAVKEEDEWVDIISNFERKMKYNCCIKKKAIIKQADTIEELCDEFVIKGTRGLYLGIPLQECELRNIPITQIYGAIWTDKGLIYVAKMNEKGELELL